MSRMRPTGRKSLPVGRKRNTQRRLGIDDRTSVENRACGVEVYVPMDPISSMKLRWLHGALHDVTSELALSRFSRFAPHPWGPAINAYRCETCVRMRVDLP